MPDADRFALPDLSTLAPPDVDFWSLRMVEETSETYTVRKNVALPLCASVDRGAMATVYADGGYGYAATGDTSAAGPPRGARPRRRTGPAPPRNSRSWIRGRCRAPPRAATTRRRRSAPGRARAANGSSC